MAIIIKKCPDCQKEIDVYCGQYAYFGQLMWHASFNCFYCGNVIEEDGIGMPPEDIRKAILSSEGRWTLEVWETGDRATLTIKIIREALQLSRSDAIMLKKKIPGKVLTGTQAEIHRLQQLLEVRDIQSSLSRIEN